MKHGTIMRRYILEIKYISRKRLKEIIRVIQKILGEVKFYDQNKMNESESISLNYFH